jgi:hypothetical protein
MCCGILKDTAGHLLFASGSRGLSAIQDGRVGCSTLRFRICSREGILSDQTTGYEAENP